VKCKQRLQVDKAKSQAKQKVQRKWSCGVVFFDAVREKHMFCEKFRKGQFRQRASLIKMNDFDQTDPELWFGSG
jgi:hypothetical protein